METKNILLEGVTHQPRHARQTYTWGSVTHTFGGNVVETPHDIPASDTPTPTPEHEYVDLGLPSGTLWAKMNIGATNENELGTVFEYDDFFQTNPETGNIEYINTQYPSELFPNRDQVVELANNTTVEVVYDNYAKLTSKINGNSLILTFDDNYIAGLSLSYDGINLILFDTGHISIDSGDLPFPLRAVKDKFKLKPNLTTEQEIVEYIEEWHDAGEEAVEMQLNKNGDKIPAQIIEQATITIPDECFSNGKLQYTEIDYRGVEYDEILIILSNLSTIVYYISNGVIDYLQYQEVEGQG